MINDILNQFEKESTRLTKQLKTNPPKTLRELTNRLDEINKLIYIGD